MVALKKYARLEGAALWRAHPDEQRREVIVSIGDATLVISDMQDRALTHWSLAAVVRANPGKRPAVFHPDGDAGETLEFAEDEAQMIDAIEKLRRAIDRSRPKPGRVRWAGVLLSVGLVAALAFFWLPGALVSHTMSVVPQVKRAEIGAALSERLQRMTGPACSDPAGQAALRKLRARLGTGPLQVVPGAISTALALPGGVILLDRALVEDFEEPDVVAGYVLAADITARANDPLRQMLTHVGTVANFQFLTTGAFRSETIDSYAQLLLTETREIAPTDALLQAFEARDIRSTAYAYALDVTGETVLPLIEGDPMAGRDPVEVLSDADWLRLQNICGG